MSDQKFIMLWQTLGLSNAFTAAVRTGVMTQLCEDTPKTIAQIAEKCGVNERSLRGILDAFLSFELVTFDKEKGTYIAPVFMREAAAKTPGGFEQLVDVFGSTEKFLRTGSGYETNFSGTSTVREDAYEKAVHYLGIMFEQAARETASKLTPAKNIIDIGAGSGIWSLSMATGRDDVKVSAVDFPKVLVNFRKFAEKMDVKQVATFEGSFLEIDNIPKHSYDRVVIANYLRIENAQIAERIVIKASELIKEGGELVVIDAFGDGNVTSGSEKQRAIYVFKLTCI
eukprot:TRINITY_DN11354_c0_g1_i1.p1 TRINITY_DN11354_c0_g1~~TRINITY_DN11354_c0_g1_i1.p1  ORF type:complete len:299 (+),score=27.16 TRINITY_DN11354_c0_g1_i1:48-899(+)